MDPPKTPDQSHRAGSVEAVTTRPNPFGDAEGSLRKRQRTSASSSPKPSLRDHQRTGSPTPPTTVAEDDESTCKSQVSSPRRAAHRKVEDHNATATLGATQEGTISSHPSSPVTSLNKVTINVRKSTGDSTRCRKSSDEQSSTKSLLASEESATKGHVARHDFQSDQAGKSNQNEGDTTNISAQEISSGSEDTGSTSSTLKDTIAKNEEAIRCVDPFTSFPFTDRETTPCDAISQIYNHLIENEQINSYLLDDLCIWMQDFLENADQLDPELVLHNLIENAKFWETFPSILYAFLVHRPSIHPDVPPPNHLDQFCRLFSRLAVCLTTFDMVALDIIRRSQVQDPCECHDLWSTAFLRQSRVIIRHAESNQSTQAADTGGCGPWPSLLLKYREWAATDGVGFSQLTGLLKRQLQLLKAFPRLLSDAVWVCHALVNDLQISEARLIRGLPARNLAKRRCQAYALWQEASKSLEELLSSKISMPMKDAVADYITVFAELYQQGLDGTHEAASASKSQLERGAPPLPPALCVFYLQWKWQGQVLVKLIKSDQMQLRVLGMTMLSSLCFDLYNKRESGPPSIEFHMLDLAADWLQQSHLFEYILGSQCHPEIIAESNGTLGFLVLTNRLGSRELEELWHSIVRGQEPRITEALTCVLSSLVNLLDYDKLITISQLLQDTPLHIMQSKLSIVRELVLQQMINVLPKGHLLSAHPFKLCLRLLQESSAPTKEHPISDPALLGAAAQNLTHLLAKGVKRQDFPSLYDMCHDDIASTSKTSLGSLLGLLKLRDSHEFRASESDAQKQQFARLVVNEFRAAIQRSKDFSNHPVLSGSWNFPRRDAIKAVISQYAASLDETASQDLFDSLVGHQGANNADRIAGWHIIMLSVAHKSSGGNVFLSNINTSYLSRLQPAIYSAGMLRYLQQQLEPSLAEGSEVSLEKENQSSGSLLFHVWRILLLSPDPRLADEAMALLAVDVHLDSQLVLVYPPSRLRQMHCSLVDQCLELMRFSTQQLASDGEDASGNTHSERDLLSKWNPLRGVKDYKRAFTRCLKLLRFFLQAHQERPQFTVPDLQSLIREEPFSAQGDPILLKYQAYDDETQTDVHQVDLGNANTVSHLLSFLRLTTGFRNYRLIHRGHFLRLTNSERSVSLEDMHLDEGLLLVLRERSSGASDGTLGTDLSPLQIHLTAHFPELWSYLSLEEDLAEEVFELLIKLPLHKHTQEALYSEHTKATDVFPSEEPFKALYALYVLTRTMLTGPAPVAVEKPAYPDMLSRPIALMTQAVCYTHVHGALDHGLRARVLDKMLATLLSALGDLDGSTHLVGKDIAFDSTGVTLLDIYSRHLRKAAPVCIRTALNTLAVILRLALQFPAFMQNMAMDSDFVSITLDAIQMSPLLEVREQCAKLIFEASLAECQHHSEHGNAEGTLSPPPLFDRLFTSAKGRMNIAVSNPTYSLEFLSLLSKFLSQAYSMFNEGIESVAVEVTALLMNHDPQEVITDATPFDPLAQGLSEVLLTCFSLDSRGTCSTIAPRAVASRIFQHLLFVPQDFEPRGQQPRLILNSYTRERLYSILTHLMRHDGDILVGILRALAKLVPYDQVEVDPYVYRIPFHFQRSLSVRSPCDYVGLRNLSNTCYLNSLLTQLYMNTAFRSFILRCRTRTGKGLLEQLQVLFSGLQETYHDSVGPESLVSLIRDYDDTPIDIHSQMDVDEFYNLLFDRLENELSSPSRRQRLRSFYGGQLVQQMKSLECDHISERLEPFSAIQCDIKGKTTLQESLQAYVDGEIMDGNDKYKCSACERHVNAVKRACFQELPDNLIFHLKRFDFNLKTLRRSKINDYFAYPPKIDMAPFSAEYLSGSADAHEDMYELVGVLVHAGTAESGHYYSYIRDRVDVGRSDDWIEFNDEVVSPWDPNLIEPCTFGGRGRRQSADGKDVAMDKAYSAYMLFYQRSSTIDQCQSPTDELVPARTSRVPVPSEIKEMFLEENGTLLNRHCLFDPSHVSFVQQCIEDAITLSQSAADAIAPSNGVRPEKLLQLTVGVAFNHLDQVVTRIKDVPQLGEFARTCENLLFKSAEAAMCYHKAMFQQRVAARNLIQRNPQARVRIAAASLLMQSAKIIRAERPLLYCPEEEDGQPVSYEGTGENGGGSPATGRGRTAFPEPAGVLQRTMRIFDNLWYAISVHMRSWDEVFALIGDFARLGHREVSALLSSDYICRLAYIVLADGELDLPQTYQRITANICRRNGGRMPSCVSVIETLEYLVGHLAPRIDPDSIVEDASDRCCLTTGPFPWSTSEINALHLDPSSMGSCYLVERLLAVDQAPEATHSLFARLIKLSDTLECATLTAVVKHIAQLDSERSVKPALQAARVFVRNARQLHNIQELMRHLESLARRLPAENGEAFVDIFREGLQMRDRVPETYAVTLTRLAHWVPSLLAMGNLAVGFSIRDLVRDHLSATGPDSPADLCDMNRNLALSCLAHLEIIHLRRNNPIRRETAEAFFTVIADCSSNVLAMEGERGSATSSEDDTMDEAKVNLEEARQDMLVAIQHLLVDQIEEDDNSDDTDWDESGASSVVAADVS